MDLSIRAVKPQPSGRGKRQRAYFTLKITDTSALAVMLAGEILDISACPKKPSLCKEGMGKNYSQYGCCRD
jgi:hypothetical protein